VTASLTKEVVEGVHRLQRWATIGWGPWPNVYLIEDGNGLIVIDTGMKGSAHAILRRMAGLGYTNRDVIVILCTHHHFDHVGSLNALVSMTGAPGVVHSLDAPYVEGSRRRQPDLHGLGLLFFIGWPIIRPQPTPVLRLQEYTMPSRLRAIHTPPHTEGSTCFFLEDSGVLFSGDMVMSDSGIRLSEKIRTKKDYQTAHDSLLRLLELDFETLLPGHGPPVTQNARESVAKLCETTSCWTV